MALIFHEISFSIRGFPLLFVSIYFRETRFKLSFIRDSWFPILRGRKDSGCTFHHWQYHTALHGPWSTMKPSHFCNSSVSQCERPWLYILGFKIFRQFGFHLWGVRFFFNVKEFGYCSRHLKEPIILHDWIKVAFCLSVKTKSLIWICVLPLGSFLCKSNRSSYERFCPRTSFQTWGTRQFWKMASVSTNGI